MEVKVTLDYLQDPAYQIIYPSKQTQHLLIEREIITSTVYIITNLFALFKLCMVTFNIYTS